MGKNKYNKKNQREQQQQDYNKKKKNIITQQLLMDKSNMDFTQFIPLLPQDILYPPFHHNPNSIKAIIKILTDLNYLLYLQSKQFWATVTYNISFSRCLSSCLSQFSTRWMNIYKFTEEEQDYNEDHQDNDLDFNYRLIKNNQYYQYTDSLQQILLKIIYRIMAFNQQDPKLNQIYNFGQNTINKMNIFSFPKLLQFIQIYSQSNNQIVKTISKNYLKTLPNNYKYFTQFVLPHLIKKVQQCNRDMKILIDREQFGINYSYKRVSKQILSAGEQQLKRKVNLLMIYLSFLRIIKNIKYLTHEIQQHCYYNYQVNFILQNTFYELDSAYKIISYQNVQHRLLPIINSILHQIVQYFIEYFNKINQLLIIGSGKLSYIQAYCRSFERILIDYGKRHSLGKRGNNIRSMTLYSLIMKKVNLIQILQQIYNQEMDNKKYQFNIEYLVDFKLSLEDTMKNKLSLEDTIKNDQQYICELNNNRQNQIEEETQLPHDENIHLDDIEIQNNDKQSLESESEQKQNNKQSSNYLSAQQQHLQFIISKKSLNDDYYQQLYRKQQQKFKIQYQDQYDDLVDYDKRPLFMDSQSSDSQSQQEQKKHLVKNQDNQKNNIMKHLKYQQKNNGNKTNNNKRQTGNKNIVNNNNNNVNNINKSKYSKVTQQQKKQQLDNYKNQSYSQSSNQSQQSFYKQPHSQQGKKKYKQKPTNTLNQLVQQQQNLQNLQQQQSRGQSSRGGYKKRYHPNKDSHGHNDKFRQKGANHNKNKQYGNQLNSNFGGGKKYREKY